MPRFPNAKFHLNNSDRSEWIDNDEGLYDWWRASRLSKTAFIREHKEEIDQAIYGVLNREPGR